MNRRQFIAGVMSAGAVGHVGMNVGGQALTFSLPVNTPVEAMAAALAGNGIEFDEQSFLEINAYCVKHGIEAAPYSGFTTLYEFFEKQLAQVPKLSLWFSPENPAFLEWDQL